MILKNQKWSATEPWNFHRGQRWWVKEARNQSGVPVVAWNSRSPWSVSSRDGLPSERCESWTAHLLRKRGKLDLQRISVKHGVTKTTNKSYQTTNKKRTLFITDFSENEKRCYKIFQLYSIILYFFFYQHPYKRESESCLRNCWK